MKNLLFVAIIAYAAKNAYGEGIDTTQVNLDLDKKVVAKKTYFISHYICKNYYTSLRDSVMYDDMSVFLLELKL